MLNVDIDERSVINNSRHELIKSSISAGLNKY